MWKVKPESLEEELSQNLAFLLSTPKGSVLMMRDFGIDTELLDRATNEAKMKLKVEIYRQVKRYEPRVEIKNIEFEEDEEGKLRPRVRWERRSF